MRYPYYPTVNEHLGEPMTTAAIITAVSTGATKVAELWQQHQQLKAQERHAQTQLELERIRKQRAALELALRQLGETEDKQKRQQLLKTVGIIGAGAAAGLMLTGG